MRADRLVAILLLLQRHGTVTAAMVAGELEVSERTARRDLEALGMAGMPVFAMRGRGGGWRLAGDGRTDLTGLTDREVRALFLVAGPQSAAAPDLRAALRKLVRALPEPFQTQAETASRSTIVEPGDWGRERRPMPTPQYLDIVQEAVVRARVLEFDYVRRDRVASRREVHPLGIAAKGTLWYLVADTEAGLRTFRIDRISSPVLTENPVVQPDGFELDAAWKLISDQIREQRMPVRAKALVRIDRIRVVRLVLNDGLRIGTPTTDGWMNVELRAESIEALGARIAGFGNWIRIVDHPELVALLCAIAEQLRALYEPSR
jgi:predicted DNA-binding transcriptional regulator YafY